MGVLGAGLGLIADAADTVAQFVAVFVYVYSALIFAYVILSWIQVPYALNWLQLGLSAHESLPAGYCPPPEVPYRTVPETSLKLLLSLENGRNWIWG